MTHETLQEFANYCAKYGKSYNSVEDFEMRSKLYFQTKAEIVESNS